MNRKGEAIAAFVSGTILGVSIGILFAPDKGKNTRNRFSHKLEKYRNKLKDLISNYSSAIETDENEVITIAKSESMKVVNDAKAQAEALLNDVEELIGQIKGKKL